MRQIVVIIRAIKLRVKLGENWWFSWVKNIVLHCDF